MLSEVKNYIMLYVIVMLAINVLLYGCGESIADHELSKEESTIEGDTLSVEFGECELCSK